MKTLAALGTALLSCAAAFAVEPTWPRFTDVTASAGITWKHSLGGRDMKNIVEATGAGCCVFDYNNDGLMDIYFVSGRWHPDISDNRDRQLKGKLHNALYRNNGDGTFTDVTVAAGVGGIEDGYGMAASAADYDNDGCVDLFVCNYGRNFLYHNKGDGTFTDVTEKAGLAATGPGWSVAAPWIDYDKDGRLDLFVVDYLQYDKGAFQRTGAYYKADNFPGPLSYPGLPDHLYRNNGDGTFTEVTQAAGLSDPNGRGMGGVACDLNGDGWPDLYVTNDAMPNELWINDGHGHFKDMAADFGAAFGEGGQGVSSMGPVVADLDRNGLLDILVPNMRYGTLLLQQKKEFFLDASAQTGMAVLCGQYAGWGGLLADFDNDGYADLFIANGNSHHLYPDEAVMAKWDGRGHFLDTARQSGDYFDHKYVARGAAMIDFNNDGNPDIVVCVVNDVPHLLRNDGGVRNWLKVVPRRRDSGAIALGSVVTVKAAGLTQIQPVIGVNSYVSSGDPRPNFGLGSAEYADTVEILWPDGEKQVLTHVAARQILQVRQGETK